MPIERHLRFFLCIAVVFGIITIGAGSARAQQPGAIERHAAYCAGVFDYRIQLQKVLADAAQQKIDRLTTLGKTHPLSADEKHELESAGVVIQTASDRMRHLSVNNERLHAFLATRGYEPGDRSPTSSFMGQAADDVESCENQKGAETQAFSKCNMDCEGKGAACLH